jgi:hypothetical protein
MFPREAFRMLTAAISAALLLLFGFFFLFDNFIYQLELPCILWLARPVN